MNRLITVFMVLSFGINSIAGTIKLLKQNKVSGSYILLSDVSDSAKNSQLKRVVLASAPAIGSSVYLSGDTIKTVLQRYGIKEKIIGKGIYIYRPGYKISPVYARKLLFHFLKKNDIHAKIEAVSGPTFMIVKRDYHIAISINRELYPAILNLNFQSNGYFHNIRYQVYLKHNIKIPVAAGSIKAGSIISYGMIDYKNTNEYRLSKTVISSADYLIGKRLLSGIRSGSPFYKNKIDLNIVKRGEIVTLFYKTKNLMVRKQGIAIDNGAQGKTISVRLDSKKIVKGIVVSRNLIRLF